MSNVVANWLGFAVVAVASSRLGIYATKIKFPVICGYVFVVRLV